MSLSCQFQWRQGDFSLSVDTDIPGDGVTAICGPSGSGKTSFLRCIAGLENPAQGQIRFGEQQWQNGDRYTPPEQRGIGYVFQDARLFPHLSVMDNLRFAVKRRRQNGPDIDSVCQWTRIEHLLSRGTDNLSGGEKKRIAIARCLLQAPQLMLMDEPLAGLHEEARLQMLDLLATLPAHLQAPLIYVSHSFSEVSRLADHVLLFEAGRITAQGSVMAMANDLQSPLTHRDNAASVLHARIAEHDDHYDLTFARIGNGCGLWLARQNLPLGTEVRLQLPARDISLALQPAEASSILNVLPSRIDSIEDSHGAHVLVRLLVGEQYVLARITRKSLDRLKLQPGQTVFAQIKTASLLSERLGVSTGE